MESSFLGGKDQSRTEIGTRAGGEDGFDLHLSPMVMRPFPRIREWALMWMFAALYRVTQCNSWTMAASVLEQHSHTFVLINLL